MPINSYHTSIRGSVQLDQLLDIVIFNSMFLLNKERSSLQVQQNKLTNRFHVTVGSAHHLGWAAEPKTDVTNYLSETIEYIVQVLDFAGNVLKGSEVEAESGVTFYVRLDKEVKELRDPKTSPALYARRGENWEDVNRRLELENMACSYVLSQTEVGFMSHSTFESGSSTLIRFTLRRFKVWNGMSCKLSFSADTQSADYLSSQLAINAASSVSTTVIPKNCCTSTSIEAGCNQFAYSFEYGCWNHLLGEVLFGPRNPVGGQALVGVSSADPYFCLTQCGECEAGLQCNGGTILVNKAGYWREPVTYKSHECEAGCQAAPLGDINIPDSIRSETQCNEGHTGPFCSLCSRESTLIAPDGYGKNGDECVACYPVLTNYIMIAIICLALIIIVLILVAVNINFGSTVKETPVASVMIKMFMNHLHVSALAGDFSVRWGEAMQSFLDGEIKTGPTSKVVSLQCVVDNLDHYNKFNAWMLVCEFYFYQAAYPPRLPFARIRGFLFSFMLTHVQINSNRLQFV